MTSARSLAASVAALSFASALTAPQPALAAPATCERAVNLAALSGAELLRINKLEVRDAATPDQPKASAPDGGKVEESATADAANRPLSSGALDRGDVPTPDPEDSDTLSEGIGMTGTGVLGYLGVLPRAATRTATRTDGVSGHGVKSPTDSALAPGSGGGRQVGEETGTDGSGSDGTGTDADKPGSAPNDDAGSDSDANSDSTDSDSTDSGSDADFDSDSDADSGATGLATGEGSQETGAGDARTTSAAMSEVGLGEARTAMIGTGRITSAAYARMLNGNPRDKASATYSAMVKPLLQQAPPTNAKAARRSTPSGKAGPLRLGGGKIRAHAQWDAGMACGSTAGETGRADAELTSVSLMNNGRGALVRIPGTMKSRGTTALQHSGDEARTVATSTVTAGRIELAGGKIRVRVLRAPALEAAMSATAGGKVSYRPAIVEVSGRGIPAKRLETAGEHVEITLKPDRHATESVPLRGLADVGNLRKAVPLPVPTIPGLPPVAGSQPESTSAPTTGTRVRISLGDVHHATKGHAIAARANAVTVSLTQTTVSKVRSKDGYGTRVSLDMALGVLEAAAVSPEAPGTREMPSAGAGGGLPVTGPRVDRVAMVGGGLLLVGLAAVLVGLRRRRSRA